MSYLIAVASSDDVNIDLTFGAAEGFSIYEVQGTTFEKKEYRAVPVIADEGTTENNENSGSPKGNGDCSIKSGDACDSGKGCGDGKGCGHGGEPLPKVELIRDCRSLVCKKIGFQAQKQLEKKQISSFDVACGVTDALTKITAYFDKIDNHKPFSHK